MLWLETQTGIGAARWHAVTKPDDKTSKHNLKDSPQGWLITKNSWQMDLDRRQLIKDIMMIKSILTILVTVTLLSACGGGEGTPIAGSTSDNTVITVAENNQLLILSPTTKEEIKITGSNNLITINTTPKIVRLTGSDNTIKIENKGKVLNEGSGNIILNLDGSASTLN